MDYKWDIFIGYSGPDISDAQELYNLLNNRCRVFFAPECGERHKPFTDSIPEALNSSKIFIFLISSNNLGFLEDEIASAIDLYRKQGRPIFPVYLNGKPDRVVEMPFGLNRIPGYDEVIDGGITGIAEKILASLGDFGIQQPEKEIVPDLNPDWQTNSLQYKDRNLTAIELDRDVQWGNIVRSCKENMNTFFLIHGNSKQNLTLFLERIERFLSTETKLPHTVYRVPFKIEHSCPTCGAEWENHILHTLSSNSGEKTLVRHLYEKSYHKCLLLILGLQPLHDLKPLELQGIRDLITKSLPKILKKTKPRCAIRFLMAIDYDDQRDNTHKQIDDWGLEAEKKAEIQYVTIPEVTFPDWPEVETYLLNLRPRPDEITLNNIKKEFNTIKIDDKLTFQYLADRVIRYIGDI